MEAAGDHGGHKGKTQSTGGWDNGGNKSRADLYAGAVAQRVLFGPASRCRSGGAPRRVTGKDSKPPSRLSKMSGAEGT